MFERFPRASRLVLERARDEAAVLGSKDLEAEHILLALARGDDPVVREVLTEAGLDRDAVRRAIEAQDEAALASVGVSRAAFSLPPARRLMRTPGWATSSRQVMIRAMHATAASRASRIQPGHLLLGVLRAEAGTVPRALSFAGVDQIALATKTQAALDARLRAAS